jgi:chromosome segregation ATPase
MAFTAEALEPDDWQDEAELAAVVPFAPPQASNRAWVLAPSSEEIAELRKQIDVKITAAKMLNERVRKLTADGATKDKRIAALEAQLAAIHEDVSHHENENHSLRTSLDLSVVEGARLSGRLWDTGVEADALRARLETLKATLIASEAERDRLTAAKRDAIELHRIELDALTSELQTMTAQTAAAESKLVDLRRSLAARTDDSREASRKAADAARERDVAVAEVADLRDRLGAKDRVTQDLERSRAQLMGQAGNLLEAFEARAAALAEAEAKAQALSRQVKEAEVKSALAQNQIATLTAKLERGEGAFVEAADAVQSLVKRVTDAEANAREAQNETERLAARMRSHEAALAEASDSVQLLAARAAGAEADLRAAEGATQFLTEKIESQRSVLDEAAASIKRLNERTAAAENKATEGEAKIAAAESKNDGLASELQQEQARRAIAEVAFAKVQTEVVRLRRQIDTVSTRNRELEMAAAEQAAREIAVPAAAPIADEAVPEPAAISPADLAFEPRGSVQSLLAETISL